MIDIESIADLELLRESVDLECKLAAGRRGEADAGRAGRGQPG